MVIIFCIIGFDVSKILIIISDVKDDNSLINVTKRAKIVINCTGPNTLLSEYIVKACIQTGTHYVDISAELYVSIEIIYMASDVPSGNIY